MISFEFAQLYNEILPFIGEFFGRIVGLATYRVDVLMMNIGYSYDMYVSGGVLVDVVYEYGNFFVGDGFSDLSSSLGVLLPAQIWQIPILNTILHNSILGLLNMLFFATPTAPLWIALPVGFASWGFIISVGKFLVHLVT